MRIELHIDRLVLDGVDLDPRHTAALREALVDELASAFSEDGTWRSHRARRVVAPTARLSGPFEPAPMARALARSIHAGLTAPRPRAVPGSGIGERAR